MKRVTLLMIGLCLVLSQPTFATVLFSDNFNLENSGVGTLNYSDRKHPKIRRKAAGGGVRLR